MPVAVKLSVFLAKLGAMISITCYYTSIIFTTIFYLNAKNFISLLPLNLSFSH